MNCAAAAAAEGEWDVGREREERKIEREGGSTSHEDKERKNKKQGYHLIVQDKVALVLGMSKKFKSHSTIFLPTNFKPQLLHVIARARRHLPEIWLI
jgi:hypothetical protein